MTAPVLIPGEQLAVLASALQDAIVLTESGAAATGCEACEKLHGHRCPAHHACGPRVTGYRDLLRALTAPPLDAGASLHDLLAGVQDAREVFRAAEAREFQLEELVAEHHRQAAEVRS